MSKKVKIILLSIIGLMILVGVGLLIHRALTKPKPEEHEIKYNENNEILKDSEIKGMKIYDISLKIEDGKNSYYSAKGINTTDKAIDFVGIVITFYKEEEQMGKIEIYNQRTIEPGETIELENITDIDLYNATSYKVDWIGE